MTPLSSSTYLGVDVLDGPSDVSGLTSDAPSRRITVLPAGPGLAWADAHEATPRYRRTLRLWAEGGAELADLIGWLDARRGRALPFWLPSWDADLTLASSYFADGGVQLVVESAGYAELMFPTGPSRRHLLVRLPSGVLACRRVTSAGWDGIGPEVIDLSAALAEDLPARTPLSCMRYCRLDQDEARIVYRASGAASCELSILELPQECPA